MSLFKSIATFGSLTLISRFAGFIRDVVIAKYLGAGMMSDAFLVSFKLPNLFRSLFAEGAFNTAFVPMLSHKIVSEGKEKSFIFSSKAISTLTFILAIFSMLIIIFMPIVVKIMAPGFMENPEKMELTINLSRITFIYLLLVSIVSFQSGILNSLGKFAAPASTPILLNLVMASSIFIFTPLTKSPAYSLAVGVMVAGFMQILWLSYFIRKEQYQIRPRFDIFTMLKDNEIRTLFRKIAPGVLGAGVYQINIMIGTILVSLLGEGAVSWLYYADRLQQVPLGVVGAAIGVALLPILSKQLKSGDLNLAKNTQDNAIEYGFLLSLPATIILIILSQPIVSILFERGAFGAMETQMTYKALIAYVVGLPFYVMIKSLSPNFFARGNTKTPVKYSIVSLVSNLLIILLLIKPLGHIGVALATSLSAIILLGQYVRGLKKRNHWSFTKPLVKRLLKILICSIIMGMVLKISLETTNSLYPDWLTFAFIKKLFILSLISFLGVATFLIMARITNVIDFAQILKSIRKQENKTDARKA